MGDIKTAYGTSTAITCTLASLASSATAGRESTAIDNTTNKFFSADITIAVALQTGTPANDKAVYVYIYGSEDGTIYDDNATGTDAAITLRVPTNLRLLGVIPCPDSGALTYEKILSTVHAYPDGLPRKWGIVIRNYTGVTLSATEGNHTKTYTGRFATAA